MAPRSELGQPPKLGAMSVPSVTVVPTRRMSRGGPGRPGGPGDTTRPQKRRQWPQEGSKPSTIEALEVLRVLGSSSSAVDGYTAAHAELVCTHACETATRRELASETGQVALAFLAISLGVSLLSGVLWCYLAVAK